MNRKKHIWSFALLVLFIAGCSSNTPLLTPQDSIEPGTSILWGNLTVDMSKMGKRLPRTVRFYFENVHSGQRVQITKSLKDHNPLIVVALAPGSYFLTDTKFSTATGDSTMNYSVDWRKDQLKYIVKANQISYFGAIDFGVSKFSRKGDKNRVELNFSSNFEHDFKVYQRFYGRNPVFQGTHISAQNGQKMHLFNLSQAQKLSQKTFYIPFKKSSNAIVVTPVINGKYPVEMLLDTGCNRTLFAPHAAKAIGLKAVSDLPIQKVTIADGSVVEMEQARVQSIALGKLKINNMTANVCKNCKWNNAVSLLCTDYLNNFHYQIDPQKNLLILKIPE